MVGRWAGHLLRPRGHGPGGRRAGRDETVDELRVEVVFPRRLRRRVTGAYVAAHPYEEPAFDVVPLENEVATLGLGRLGVLPTPTTLAALAAEVAAVLRLPSVRYAGDGRREVRRVAVLPAPAPRPSPAASPRSPTCSSPVTSSTTRCARRRPRPGAHRRTARRHRAGGRAALGRASPRHARPGRVGRDVPRSGGGRVERRGRRRGARFAGVRRAGAHRARRREGRAAPIGPPRPRRARPPGRRPRRASRRAPWSRPHREPRRRPLPPVHRRRRARQSRPCRDRRAPHHRRRRRGRGPRDPSVRRPTTSPSTRRCWRASRISRWTAASSASTCSSTASSSCAR